MDPVLIDTSVWIDFFKGHKTAECRLLHDYITRDEPVLICPPVIQEVLQGIKSDSDYIEVRESILSLDILIIEPVEAAVGAAELYRNLRKNGLTIKRTNDSLIAFYSIYFKVPLLHRDNDFNRIAKFTSLKIKKIE